jgi:hypothetical protein
MLSRPAAALKLARHPSRSQIDRVQIDYVRYASPPMGRSYGSWGNWAAKPLGRALAKLRTGWGLDAHWAAIAAQRGWPIGIVDATHVGHTLRPVAADYPREDAIAEAQEFLRGRPYLRRDEIRTVGIQR